ncbi:long chain acyl-CoA synthetase 1-like [Phragmites australis]|uniref:long chain acyl-CoA synthetase 1-like n=1 Tax=Phragmites australis TaxID=29695 RepID=UPI002D76968B|nr:long chain acyl-CoA synthetase 1-like [Phragmites australis]
MEANPKNIFSIKVEDGKPGKDGRPAVGPVFRNVLAKDGFPELEADMKTSWDVFRVAAGKYPNNRMLGWRPLKDGVPGPYLWKSYKEVYEEVLQVGSALQQLGVQPGYRVGIYGTNCPQWIVAMQACNGYSLICVPLYDTLGAGAVNYIIDHAEIDVVFIQDKKIKEILSPNCKSAKRLKALVAFTSATSEQINGADQIGMKMYSWHDFLKMGKDNPGQPCPPQANDTCTIMYTSGTSGEPKGVILSHESHALYVKGVDLFMDQFDDKMTTEDVFLSFLPLAHILDRMIEEYFFHKGASVGYYHGDLNALREDITELKPTLLVGVPRVYERIYEGILKAIAELRPLRRVIFNALYNRKLGSMKAGYSHKTASPFADMLAFRKVKARLGGRLRLLISGGAPLSTEIEEFLRVTTCAYFIQGYGLTETLGPSTVCYIDDMALVGTVGVAATYTEMRLEEVPEMGYDPLGVPSRGEICIRGKCMFTGYYKNPELTNEAIIDGWFHTGDIGEMTPDGILKVIDRKKNIFKLSQGEYVAVEYLEKLYGFPPLIEDICVYGDSFKSSLVAVVNPHEENTMKWAESNGYKGSFGEICKLEGLKENILKELTAVAQKNKLRGFEYIKGIVLDPIPFDIERDLVTATMKKRRNNMLKYYQSEIDKVYKKVEAQKNATKAK